MRSALAALPNSQSEVDVDLQQPTGSIAFMVCEDNARVFSEPFFPLILRSVSRELASCDIQLVLLTAHSTRDYQIASRYLRSGHVDGALLVSMHGKRPLDLHSLGVPVVLAGRSFGNDDGISYVDADNAGGARMAVEYLLKNGREMVATIAGPPDMAPGADRLTGYRKAMAEAGLGDPSAKMWLTASTWLPAVIMSPPPRSTKRCRTSSSAR